jgi:hypothetical protein
MRKAPKGPGDFGEGTLDLLSKSVHDSVLGAECHKQLLRIGRGFLSFHHVFVLCEAMKGSLSTKAKGQNVSFDPGEIDDRK